MTLEHIDRPAEFLSEVRRRIAGPSGCPVVFMVPNAGRILDEGAFEDIYYEHCSYFTEEALTNLFCASGFSVTSMEKLFEYQYLLVNAVPSHRGKTGEVKAITRDEAEKFKNSVSGQLGRWRLKIAEAGLGGKNVVLWGGGSKAVAFVTALGLDEEIAAVVDINPRKKGTFLPGSGHPIVCPSALVKMKPGLVIVMNVVYLEEVKAELARLQVGTVVIPVDAFRAR
jgi:hypothetical protein